MEEAGEGGRLNAVKRLKKTFGNKTHFVLAMAEVVVFFGMGLFAVMNQREHYEKVSIYC